MYKQIGVFKPVMCEDRSMDDPADEGRQELSHCRSADEKTDTHDTQDEGSVSKTLYDVVIAPILHLIKGNEVIIVPDSSSFLIPYAALMDQHSRYLSETLRIRLAPSLTSLKEQYPVTAHAPNFDFWTGCREIKRCEKSKRILKNPLASRLAGFNTTLKLLRITDQ